MNKKTRLLSILSLALLAALMFPTTVAAAPADDGKTVFGETYTLGSGEILEGDLNVFGGVVTVESGAVITGDTFVLGGVVTIDGTLQGNLTVIGGTVTLEDHAIIQGNLTSPASYVHRAEGAVIQGDIIQNLDIPWSDLDVPQINPPEVLPSPAQEIVPAVTDLAQTVGMTLVLAALGALLLLVMPKSAETMTKALVGTPWHVLGYGILTALVMLVGGVVLIITICFIPIAILLAVAFGLAVLTGWLALGYQLGKFIETGIFKANWHPVLKAALGNLVLYLLAKGLQLTPYLGGVLAFIAALFGLGMSIVTLFGTRSYPRTPGVKPDQPEVISLPPDNGNDADTPNESPDIPDPSGEDIEG